MTKEMLSQQCESERDLVSTLILSAQSITNGTKFFVNTDLMGEQRLCKHADEKLGFQ